MTNELIAKFVEGNVIPATKSVQIDFKKRASINGLIVRSNDYDDLKSKKNETITMTRALSPGSGCTGSGIIDNINGANIDRDRVGSG